MEHLLNVVWLSVSVVLLAAMLRAWVRSELRCSLALAIGCTALLALVLFPALSMTDDLQMARLDVETSGRHLDAVLLLGLPNDGLLQAGLLATALLLIVIALSRRSSPMGNVQRAFSLPKLRLTGFRPEAVRPPPAFAC